jgi:hypothetical protein
MKLSEAERSRFSIIPPLASVPPAPAAPRPASGPVAWNYAFSQPAQAAQGVTARFANVAQQNRLNAFAKFDSVDKKTLEQLTINGEIAQVQPLSTEFDFEQNGDRVRIVDADGSIYDGQLLQARVAAEKQKDAASGLGERGSFDVSGPQTPVRFSVSGTNRTLNKVLVVDAAILADAAQSPPAAKDALARPARRAPKPAATVVVTNAAAQIFRAGRITGTIRFDKTNELPIDAKRLSP